jgi:hypothetical protein
MLRSEAIMRGSDEIGPIQPYIPFPLEGIDLSSFTRATDKETGAVLIEEMRAGFKKMEKTFTHEEMMASIIASIELSGEELSEVIPDQSDTLKVENIFLGLVYVGSKYFPGTFASGMRIEYKEKPSYLKILSTEGIETVAGTFHRLLDAK